MLFLARAHLREIAEAAEAAYPRECCGLLVGRIRPSGDHEVLEVVASPNRDESGRRDRFEIDSQLYIDVQRRLRGSAQRVIGVYHSHCDHRAQPSETDLDLAWEPAFVWLITAVEGGQAVHTTVHVLEPGGTQFREIGLRTLDWEPYPRREPMPDPGLGAG